MGSRGEPDTKTTGWLTVGRKLTSTLAPYNAIVEQWIGKELVDNNPKLDQENPRVRSGKLSVEDRTKNLLNTTGTAMFARS
jgi:hypothetical protein